MDKDNKRKLLLGILVASGTILFIVGIFLIGSKQNIFSRTFKISTIFNDLNGLRKGDYVRFAGVKAGVVDKITFLNDSMIKVDMKISIDFNDLIKKDAVAYIATEGLVGNKIINIRPKWRERESVKENDLVSSVNPFDTEKIIEKLMGTNDNAAVITDNLARISVKINEKKSIFETLINDTMAASDVKSILKDIKTTSSQLSAMTLNFEKIIDRVDAGEGLAGTILRDTSITKQLKQTMFNLKTSSDYATIITGELTKSMQADKKNTVALLMKDTTFAQNLNQTVINLQRSTQKLNETLDALQHISLFKKYFLKPIKNK